MSDISVPKPAAKNARNGNLMPRVVSRSMTPLAVERRYPDLTRSMLARRRALGLPPHHEVVSGCVMYRESEIERFLLGIDTAADPAAQLVRCAIYARTATYTDGDTSLGDQIAACEHRARQLGWTLAETYSDLGKPGISTDGPTGMLRLIDDATSGRFDVILTRDLSRVSRAPLDIHMFCQNMSKANLDIYTLEPDGLVSEQTISPRSSNQPAWRNLPPSSMTRITW